jgi:hypothetical protein
MMSDPKKNEQEQPEPDLAAELANVGRAVRAAVAAAWQSEERAELQQELSDGLRRLGQEIDKAFQTVRESGPAQKVETGTRKAVEDVRSGEASSRARRGLAQGLQTASRTLDNWASSFTPIQMPEEEEKKPVKGFEPIRMPEEEAKEDED